MIAATVPPADDPASRFDAAPSRGALSATTTPLSVGRDSKVNVVIEMKGDPVAVVEAEKGSPLSAGEKSAIKDDLKGQQDAITGAITSNGGTVEAKMQSAYNGIQASVPEGNLDAVASLPNVVAVHPVSTHSIDNSVSVPFLGVPEVWQNTGYTGKNVKVAIIDTGIDYTHADFGGPGTVASYEEAHAAEASAANPALFGPNAPRVKGGIDLVGDSYNADPGSADYQPVPHPDPNPLDCEGHGSHVAGTAAGGGVNADGSSYTGPYDSSTPSRAFKVGPGVAPQADLYAVRVFGCTGSTDVVIQAIDWAVANDMDVINMSLGSSFGRAGDPDAVAASNAVGAGVVVVASAGNSGPNPYIVGSPSTGEGVISVAAIDSTPSYPGATISVGGQTFQAINANGADLSAVPPLTVVSVTDDPTTPENEALGCSEAAYTKAGIVPGGNQLAVVQRGTCARAAKPIYGQRAGAAAVVMVNSTADYPPYEGQIVVNPDNPNDVFTVTIPFLGVRSSDGPALRAAAGQTAVLAANTLENPTFRKYASFTSGGPRSGDSGVSPDVAAPGVSIRSVAVGTGSDSTVLSGTSMAAPHVAGVAALTVQAHPGWKAGELSAAVVSTADPEKVTGQDNRLGGVGLVDAAQSVGTQVTATGDAFRTDSGWLRETALSFGFQDSWFGFAGVKTITLENHGTSPVTYTASSAATAESTPAKVLVAPSKVTVPAGGKARMLVAVTAAASSVPSSTAGDDQFSHYEISGDVVLSSSASTLRVPYLLVPRSDSRVSATGTIKNGSGTVTLRNVFGALDASADFYQWGLTDKQDVPSSVVDTGYDLRAAGVQSFAEDGDQLMVFAVNTYKRWSNAAANEYDVNIDTNGDSEPDYVVFSADSGAQRAGDVNGLSEVFVYDVANKSISAAGFLTTAPTDSSTLLLPVHASDLGLTADAGQFSYTVDSFSPYGESDSMTGPAVYNPWAPALSNGQFEIVPRNGTVSVPVTGDAAAIAAQKPLGLMVVALDNAAGKNEALLLPAR